MYYSTIVSKKIRGGKASELPPTMKYVGHYKVYFKKIDKPSLRRFESTVCFSLSLPDNPFSPVTPDKNSLHKIIAHFCKSNIRHQQLNHYKIKTLRPIELNIII